MDHKKYLKNYKALSSMTMAVLFVFSTESFATQSVNDKDELILCKNQKLVRTLRVDIDSKKCTAIYNKNGQDKVIGSGMYVESCVQFVNNVRDNLEDASWNCRSVRESRTSMVKGEGLE